MLRLQRLPPLIIPSRPRTATGNLCRAPGIRRSELRDHSTWTLEDTNHATRELRARRLGRARRPILEPLALVLAEHLTRCPCGPNDLLFATPFNDYRRARRVFARASRTAELRSVTIHDLRHTFAVHAAQAGVPIPRIQKLLGHATVAMAMRYMQHAPEAYFAEDAAKVAGSLTGQRNSEAETRVALARAAIKGA